MPHAGRHLMVIAERLEARREDALRHDMSLSLQSSHKPLANGIRSEQKKAGHGGRRTRSRVFSLSCADVRIRS